MLKLTFAPAKLIVALFLPLLAAAIGGLVTSANIPTWYAELAKPAFNPPNWIFGPVWSLLYLLMGISLYLVWTAKYKKSKQWAFVFFGVQLALNVLWSLVFFGLHWPWVGVVVIILLLAAIVATVRAFLLISRPAAYALVPYVLWVGFAAVLNTAIALLN